MRQALKDQEMRVEHTINTIRGVGVLTIYLLNIGAVIFMGMATSKVLLAFCLSMVVFLSYFLFVRHFTKPGRYHPWLKYMTISLDYLVLTASYQKFSSIELMQFLMAAAGLEKADNAVMVAMSSDIVTSYIVIFVLFNFLSSLRNSNAIILYSTVLAAAACASILVQSGMGIFPLFYTLILVMLSGVMTFVVSRTFNALFLRLQAASRKIREYNATLERKVAERTQELRHKNERLNKALVEVEQSNKKILDSIEYAKRIQRSLLPSQETLKSILPQSMLIWLPRDIVGGDIYYTERFEDGCMVAVIDCTGHGVPGAFMTMLALSGIKRIATDEGCRDPGEILKRLNANVKTLLHQDTEQALSDDGLDASICFIDSGGRTLTFAGARQSMICVRNGAVKRMKGDRQSIGYKKSKLDFVFSNHVLEIEDGMSFYLYTDGLIDQVGGDKRVGFGHTRLNRLLLETMETPFEEQQTTILRTFEEYKGTNEIRDDVTILGFSVA
ncbi:MAG: SpoIIE family protein phosphatase [Proteobacteria bacterium]|nr:SpoIIE family protein phosphatase [Pseudomonadota bacterium]